jgi:hypothetical protein
MFVPSNPQSDAAFRCVIQRATFFEPSDLAIRDTSDQASTLPANQSANLPSERAF